TVEQQRCRARESDLVTSKEVGDVPRDRDVALVREAKSDKPCAGALRAGVTRRGREEAVEHDPLGLLEREARRERASDEPRRGAEDGDRDVLGRIVGAVEEALLRGAASDHKLTKARWIELGRRGHEPWLGKVREREIHVVAAEEEV